MRKFSELIAILLVILSMAVPIWAVFAYESSLAKKRNAIDLKALPQTMWEKKEIRVEKGKLVRIRLINASWVTHGFAIPDLGVAEVVLHPGQNEIIEFTPQYSGEYVYKCTVQCSLDQHEFMTGKVIVEE